jgi:excisionase family DNA binding protein
MRSLDSWLTCGQAARLLGVSPQYVQALADQGKLTATRVALGRLIDPASVERLAKQRRRAQEGSRGRTDQ